MGACKRSRYLRYQTRRAPLRPGLLHHMRQFVGEQPAPFMRRGREPTRTEHNVVPDSVGMDAHIPRRLIGSPIGMNAYATEVVVEALLHIVLQGPLQRRARSIKHAVHAGGHGFPGFPMISRLRGGALNMRSRSVGFRICRCREYLIGDPIRLLFQRVIARANAELSLDEHTG